MRTTSTSTACAKTLIIGILTITACILSGHAQVHATLSNQYTLLEPLPCISSNDADCVVGTQTNTLDFQNYVSYAFNLFVALAAVAAVFMIVLGGFEYMTSDAWNIKNAGIEKLKNALLGLGLVLSSYLLLKTINPKLVQIPTTLLPELTVIKNIGSNNTVGSFFNRITSDIDSLRSSTEENRQRARELSSQANAAKQRFDAVTQQLTDIASGKITVSTEELNALKLEQAKLKEEITDSATAAVALRASATFTDSVVTSMSILDREESPKEDELANIAALINTKYAEYEREIKSYPGDHTSELTAISDQRTAAFIRLATLQYSNPRANEAHLMVYEYLPSSVESIQNPELKQKSKEIADLYIEKWKKWADTE